MEDSWNEVVRFSNNRLINLDGDHGILTRISETTPDAVVFFPSLDMNRHVYMTWNERIPYLLECVKHCDAFRFEVIVQNSLIVTYKLCVNPHIFKLHIKSTTFPGEHYVLSLLKHVWKQSKVDAEINEPEMFVFDEKSTETTVDSGHIQNNEIWNSDLCLLEHQEKSVSWMLNIERTITSKPYCAYEHHIVLPGTGWYVDITEEAFTKNGDNKHFKIRGGYLCDETGSGKTVVALNLISKTIRQKNSKKFHNYKSAGTLIIVPSNIVNQWCDEIDRFYIKGSFKLIKLTKGSDLKSVTMEMILKADIVVTTINFITNCKMYNEYFTSVISNIKGQTKKSRSLFNAIARNPNISQPILQIVWWKRIIVDELHEVKGRDLRILKCFSCSLMWGLTATPNLYSNIEDLNDINFMFEEYASYHPNMYKSYIDTFMKGFSNIKQKFSTTDLCRIPLSEHEKKKFDNKTTNEDFVLSCSTLDDSINLCGRQNDLYRMIVEPSELKLHRIYISVVVASAILTAVWCVDNINTSKIRTTILKDKIMQVLNFQAARNLISTTKRTKSFMESNLKSLQSESEICPICMERKCSVITRCGHLFCMSCMATHITRCSTCPNCRNNTGKYDTFRVVTDTESSKLNAIIDVIASKKEPTIIFAQWKRVLKDIALLLQKHNSRIFMLEGASDHRSQIVNKFNEFGGVLLCVTDSFAGLRLPNVKHVIFAHALLGNYNKVKSIEIQALGRTEQNDINVVSFVSANSIEEYQWRLTHPEWSNGK